MPLDIVHGQTKKKAVADQVQTAIETVPADGTLYFGYPVLASADEKIEIDALLVTKQYGLLALIFSSDAPAANNKNGWNEISDKEDKLYFSLESTLARHEGLRDKRKLGIDISVATVFSVNPSKPQGYTANVLGLNELPTFIKSLPKIDKKLWSPLQAALQKVTNIKPPKKRSNVVKDNSRGAILKKIEKEIANLDQWQKKAAIETPDGPQRIRGLAGSGKTIVLALKAAYLHSLYPDWDIAVAFHSRALHQQFKDLIRRFCFEHINDEPNWEKLRVLNAWGGNASDGVYAEIAAHANLPIRNFLYGKSAYGMDNAFKGVCAELLSATSNEEQKPIYDAVLIDEAQDLPPEFFQLIYRFSKPPKRIIWAYDELQKLSEASMPSTLELFGKTKNGEPRVELSYTEGKPRQDIILPVCYRNPPWTLSLAHALGFGTTRKSLIQHFDDPGIWTEIGYKVVSGALEFGKEVKLERAAASYPEYFEDLLNKDDSIICQSFSDQIEQAEWIASNIEINLKTDELEHDDILIVLPVAMTAKSEARLIMEALIRRGIDSHLVGVTSDRDEFFLKKSVAIANIHRAKGNEAPMVYLANVNHCDSSYELGTKRNTLFTAITRSRAWVRICGISPYVDALFQEIKKVKDQGYKIEFKVPTKLELEKMRMIHRDKTVDEKQKIKSVEKGLMQFIEAVKSGVLSPEQLPKELRSALSQMLHADDSEDDI